MDEDAFSYYDDEYGDCVDASLKELMEQFGGDDFESAKTKEIDKIEKVKAKKQEKLHE